MRKTTLRFALLIGLTAACQAQNVVKTHQENLHQNQAQQLTANSPAQSASSPNPQRPMPEQAETRTDAKEISHAPQWPDKINAYSTLAIALFTFFTLLSLLRQIWTSRRTDRAWIIVNPVDYAPAIGFARSPELGRIENSLEGADQRNLFGCAIKNTGNTPARLLEMALCYRTATSKEEIPQKPDYGKRDNLNSLILVKEDSIGYETSLEPSEILTWEESRAVRSRALFLYAFGIVTYEDAYKRKHETRFGYLYHFPQGGDRRKARFAKELMPSTYNSAT